MDIPGAERLVRVFGRWPSFHDAEVVDLRLERRGRDDFEGPVLLARFHLFRGRKDPSRAGGVRWEDHTLATLRFGCVHHLSIAGFNHQNAILDLHIETLEAGAHPASPSLPAYRVAFEPSFGVGASFLCASVEVVDVAPGCPPGSVYGDAP